MRIAFVKSHIPIQWQSCVSIFANLKSAYSLLEPNHLEVSSSYDYQENLATVRRIREICADTIIFAGYIAEHFKELVEAITKEFALDKNKPSLVFHLYGNFSIEPNTWLLINNHIQKYPCRFVCASRRQANLVRSFMHPFAAISVESCSFPVNTKAFYFDPKARKRIRDRMNWGNDFIILYTGRITPQKNVVPMLEDICENFLSKGKKARIILAGTFDTMTAPLFKGGGKHGFSYQREYLDFLENIPSYQQKRIQYLGHKSHSELQEIYNAADTFVCWSTYHDEDFGMAPAEALATGLPSLLSSWGGFADFERKNCQLTPVEITKRGIEIQTTKFRSDLKLYFKQQKSLQRQRSIFAKEFAKSFSPLAIKKQLLSIG